MKAADYGKMAKYSDRFLKGVGLDRQYVWEFWTKHTPEGVSEKLELGTFASAKTFVDGIIAVQDFVFSDAGDRILGLPERPATAEEKDGLLGSKTWRRMEAWLDHMSPDKPVLTGSWADYVIFAGEKVRVDGVQVVTWDEPGGLNLQQAQLDKYGPQKKGRQKGYRKWPKDITKLIGTSRRFGSMLFFGHWDVCSSSKRCFRVLLAVKLGSSFGVDGDGTVWWWSDPGLYYGFHGGEANTHALLSCDLQNPVSLKYAVNQLERWGVERPVLVINRDDEIGKGKGFLGMYESQIVALLRILKTFSVRTGYPLVFPTNEDGSPFGRNIPWLFEGDWHSCATHRHLPDTTKWDVRALEHQIIVLLQEKAQYAEEFPSLVECFRIHDSWAQDMNESFKRHCRWPELGIGAE
jgi:hypothetical protein